LEDGGEEMKHASVVPLIGGSTIAMTKSFGTRPEYIMSYTPFKDNDQHVLNYYPDVPYYNLDDSMSVNVPQVDVISTICPCAGLSALSQTCSSDNKANDWMVKTAAYVLSQLKPKVFWGENSPRFASKMGKPVVEKLRLIAERTGYVMTIYKTKSIIHGLSQIRDRTFYFFWKDNQCPVIDYFQREHELIEDTIRNIVRRDDDPMNVVVNDALPTDNPFYRYLLEVDEGGITHKQFSDKITKNTNVMHEIEARNISYLDVAPWMRANGYEKEADKCERIQPKLDAGGNIMRKTTEIPKHHIGAFVGHLPHYITHPDENRYLTARECLSIMTMPDDFILEDPKKNLNHVCQNVPVKTAMDMCTCIEKWLGGEYQKEDINFMIQDNKKRCLVK
jgi:site-specific DNA-cytosine methylase